LYELFAKLAACDSLGAALQQVLEASMAVVEADAGYIRLFEIDEQEPISSRFPFVVHKGISEPYLEYFGNLAMPVDESARQAVFEGRRVHIPDMMSHPAFTSHGEIVVTEGYRTLHATPLMSRNGSRCVGSICIYYREVRTLSPAAEELLDLYAEVAANTIDHHQQVARLVSRNKALEAIAERQAEALKWAEENLNGLEVSPTVDGKSGESLTHMVGPRLRQVRIETDIDEVLDSRDEEVTTTGPYGLTQRETEVLINVWHGLSDKEAALQLGISRFTVAKHLGAAMRKLGVETRSDAIAVVGRTLVPDDGDGHLPFGTLLRTFRRRAGMTQLELAEKAGLSYRTISDLERSVRRKTYISTVEMLSSALGLEPEDAEQMAASVDRSRRARSDNRQAYSG
jgi:DNA-binding CsgD family transcriptional regulator